MDTGFKIKVLREQKQFSRETMADLLGISYNTYIKIENGEKIPNLKEIQLISDKLEVDPSLFLKKDGFIIQNVGDNSPAVGSGNVVTVDKDLINLVKEILKKLDKFLDEKD